MNQKPKQSHSPKGQAMLELALVVPILILMILGVVELGFYINHYLAVLDAARNSSRFMSDGDFRELEWTRKLNVKDCYWKSELGVGVYHCDTDLWEPDTPPATDFTQDECEDTQDFYFVIACVVFDELSQERPTISIEPELGDDILVTIFSVKQGGTTVVPGGGGAPFSITHDPYVTVARTWSYAQNLPVTGYTPNQTSRVTIAEANDFLAASTPNTGFLLVEIYDNYRQQLGIPIVTNFIPDPLPLYSRTFMPLPAAEQKGIETNVTIIGHVPSPSVRNQPVAFTATVEATSGGYPPTGSIRIIDSSGNQVCTISGSAASGNSWTSGCSYAFTIAGTYHLTAEFIPSGGDFDKSSSSTISHVVNP